MHRKESMHGRIPCERVIETQSQQPILYSAFLAIAIAVKMEFPPLSSQATPADSQRDLGRNYLCPATFARPASRCPIVCPTGHLR